MKRLLLLFVLIFFSTISTPAQDNHEAIVQQGFENGEMMYRYSTGEIFVFFRQSKQWERYTSAQYGSLNSNTRSAPANYHAPINGFGRLWAGLNNLDERLGWAYSVEIGFRAQFLRDGSDLYIWRRDGVIYKLSADGTYSYASETPSNLTPIAINDFSLTSDHAVPGETLTIAWDITGTRYALIEIYDLANNNLLEFQDFQATLGSFQWQIPDNVTGDVRVVVHGANYTRPLSSNVYFWERIISQETVVTLTHSVDVTGTHAAYQAFEQGFMIWREDTGEVRVFLDNGLWYRYTESFYATLQDTNLSSGCSLHPINAFAIVWSIGDLPHRLGCALATEEGYTLTVEPDGGQFIYNLPDSRRINLSGNIWSYR